MEVQILGPPKNVFQQRNSMDVAELKAVLRRRRGDDSGSVEDDDPGLPRSPPTSPTTLDVLNHGLKSCSRATHSTCSDGSLLSMGSSENDEDSLGVGSHHSSRVSLLEGRNQVVAELVLLKSSPQVKSTKISGVTLGDSITDGKEPLPEEEPKKGKDNEPVAGAAPLNHQAALHKISIRPRRTHGAPRARRSTQIAGPPTSLPATPEVNEEANKHHAIAVAKSSATPLPSPEALVVIQPGIDDEDSLIGLESHEPEKKEKEEKKDEPLLQRLFGSVRSGRRRSRGSGDESRENSVSPMRRGADQRTSREKRRDSSGSRFPVLGRTSTKSRQESHQLPPSGKGREPSRERSKHDVSPPSPPQTPRSASVEGRLESTTPSSHGIFRMSSYEDRPSRPTEGVRKVKSFREVQGNQNHAEGHGKIITGQMNVEENGDMSVRKTASVESLDGDTKTSSSRTISSSGVTDISASSHRSIDSLTNTSIPGVFIRPQSQHQYKVFKHKHQDQQLLIQSQGHTGQDMNSGPLSLDSSITLQSREPEDLLRKSSSVSHVGYTVESPQASIAKDTDISESAIKRVVEVKSGAKVISIEEKSDSRFRESKKHHVSPIQTSPIQIESETPPKYKSSDEGEPDGESLRRRSLKKEPSLKRLLSRESGPPTVPEFMRIQLNKVENKGHSVIYDTDQEKHSKVDSKGMDVSNVQVENDFMSSVTIIEKPVEVSKDMKIENSFPIIETKPDNKKYLKKSNSKTGKSKGRDISPSGSTLEKKDHDSGVEGSSPEPTIDRVVLRRPLVSERAPVMERASSVTSQTTPSPTKSDQPELFKVFARRSFKVKDSDKEKFQSMDSEDEDDENIEASSEISEVTVISTRAADNVSLSNNTVAPTVMSTSPQSGLQKSSINAISFNRKSVGNPTLSFCPPPVTTMTPPMNSPLSQKPTVLILSSSSSTVMSSTVTSVSTASSVMTTTSSATNNAMHNQQSKVSVSPVQVTVIRPSTGTPEVGETTDMRSTPVAQQIGITSKIISNRKSSVTVPPCSDSTSGDEIEGAPTPPPVTPTPSKTTRSGSGLVWPPRPHLDEENQSSQYVSQSNSSPVARRLSSSPSNPIEIEGSKTPTTRIEDNQAPVEVSPLDISAARRRFMSGGKDCHSTITPLAQNLSTSPTPQSSGSPALSNSRTGSSMAEARNAAPSFTITVRTPTATSESAGVTTSDSITSVDLNTSNSSNTSTTKSDQVTAQAADDWRVLVRQRREGRLKQTKTPDSEEIIIETRPPVSRNSKVLEMANNFQKLQVA